MSRRSRRPWRLVWSGGAGCRHLADVLADDRAVRVGANMATTLIETRATLHVTSQLPNVERCSVAVPHHVVLNTVDEIVATVGGGPNSLLAAAVAHRAADRLGVPARVVTGYRRPDQRPRALQALADIAAGGIDLPMETALTEHPSNLVDSLSAHTMVIVGAPGGSWFQRQFFGPGVQLRVAAPGGVVVVRQDVPRVYQVMGPPRAVGGHVRIRNVLEVTSDPVVHVADHGRPTGSVRRSQLIELPPHVEVGTVADAPVTVAAEEPVEHIWLVLDEHAGGPVGVVSRSGQLVGSVSAEDVRAAAELTSEKAS